MENIKFMIDALANNSVTFSIILVFLTLAMLLHLILIVGYETVGIKDFITKYRVAFLSFLVIFFLSIIPVAYYLVARHLGTDTETLRNLATISGRIGPFAATIALEITVVVIKTINSRTRK